MPIELDYDWSGTIVESIEHDDGYDQTPKPTPPIDANGRLTSSRAAVPAESMDIDSQKRSGLPKRPHAPSPKQPSRRSLRVAQRMARRSSTWSGSRKVQTPQYAFPTRCWDNKLWEVQAVDGIFVEDDGSLSCLLRWVPTKVSVSKLSGTLLEQVEQLVKQNDDPMLWEDWREMNGV